MASFTGNPNFTATGTGAATRPAADVMDEFVFAANFTGYDESGTTDSSAAIMAAHGEAIARNRELILSGTPRITSKLTIDAPARWRMQGQHYKPGFLSMGSVIIKDAGLDDDAIEITENAWGTILDGVAVLGEEGNGGDGFYIWGNDVTLIKCVATGMGQDGCRIGSKADVDANANGWRLSDCSFGYNVRDGLRVDDASEGPTDANAGLADGLSCVLNGGNGLTIDRGVLGNTFVAPLFEGNQGYGIDLGANATNNIFVGGDVEGNGIANVRENVLFANRFLEIVVEGYRYNNLLRNGTFAPRVVGSTSAGTGTYTTQKGYYVISGHSVHFIIELVWTAHNGAGDLLIELGTLPPLEADDINSAIPGITPVSIMSSGISFTSGGFLTAAYFHSTGKINVGTNNGGTTASLPMDSAGSLWLQGLLIPLLPN
jgi:hypothetical protein